MADEADVSAASAELASAARGAWTVPIPLPTAEVPMPSSYVRGVFSGPCGGRRGRAVRISTVSKVLGPEGVGPTSRPSWHGRYKKSKMLNKGPYSLTS